MRRGRRVDVRLPLFKDEKTIEEEVVLDTFEYGPFQCCLQLTFEAQNIEHARYLHDTLLPFGPILGALSAATPVVKGRLLD